MVLSTGRLLVAAVGPIADPGRNRCCLSRRRLHPIPLVELHGADSAFRAQRGVAAGWTISRSAIVQSGTGAHGFCRGQPKHMPIRPTVLPIVFAGTTDGKSAGISAVNPRGFPETTVSRLGGRSLRGGPARDHPSRHAVRRRGRPTSTGSTPASRQPARPARGRGIFRRSTGLRQR